MLTLPKQKTMYRTHINHKLKMLHWKRYNILSLVKVEMLESHCSKQLHSQIPLLKSMFLLYATLLYEFLFAESLKLITKYANKMEQTSFPWKGDIFQFLD